MSLPATRRCGRSVSATNRYGRSSAPGTAALPDDAHRAAQVLRIADLRQLPRPARDSEIERLAVDFARRPFDLERDWLIRACLIQADREDHVLLLTMHHIVSDGWSMSILIRELAALYTAACSGARHRLADLQVQYGTMPPGSGSAWLTPALPNSSPIGRQGSPAVPPSICRRTTRVRPCRRFAAPPIILPCPRPWSKSSVASAAAKASRCS